MADLGFLQDKPCVYCVCKPLTTAQLLADRQALKERFSVFKPGHQDGEAFFIRFRKQLRLTGSVDIDSG